MPTNIYYKMMVMATWIFGQMVIPFPKKPHPSMWVWVQSLGFLLANFFHVKGTWKVQFSHSFYIFFMIEFIFYLIIKG